MVAQFVGFYVTLERVARREQFVADLTGHLLSVVLRDVLLENCFDGVHFVTVLASEATLDVNVQAVLVELHSRNKNLAALFTRMLLDDIRVERVLVILER